MFFDIFSELCKEKGVSRYRACTDIGLNRAAVAKWKNGAIPTGSTLSKLSVYFGVSTDYLLGQEKEKAPTPEGEHHASTKSERELLVLARHLEYIPEDIRKRLVKNFADSIDIYLESKGINKGGEK